MNALSLSKDKFKGQKVLVRCNFDVPIEKSKVQDTTRIEAALPTINTLLELASQIILIAHQDRPDGKFNPDNSLKPIAGILSSLLNKPVDFIPYQSDYHRLKPPAGQISLLDNLRFWPQEKTNDPDFAKFFASLATIYVNESFATCHRSHASIVGIPRHLPAYAGLELEKEISILSQTKDNPQKPLVVVIGGAKLNTKEPLIGAFADKADHILVGGKIAQDLKDHPAKLSDNVFVADLTPNGRDITDHSAHQFAEIIMSAKTVIFNGTMGVFEEPDNQLGTKIVAHAVNSTPAFTLVGGGDTEAALTELNLEDGIDFISTGGGAMLTFLSQGTLPGIQALGFKDLLKDNVDQSIQTEEN